MMIWLFSGRLSAFEDQPGMGKRVISVLRAHTIQSWLATRRPCTCTTNTKSWEAIRVVWNHPDSPVLISQSILRPSSIDEKYIRSFILFYFFYFFLERDFHFQRHFRCQWLFSCFLSASQEFVNRWGHLFASQHQRQCAVYSLANRRSGGLIHLVSFDTTRPEKLFSYFLLCYLVLLIFLSH